MKAPMKRLAGALASILQILVVGENKPAGEKASLLTVIATEINPRGE
jgi:hypothetical protein